MGRCQAQVPNEDSARLTRVLDAKWRTIGVDKEALDKQVEEKKAAQAQERARDEQFAKLSQHFADQLTIQQQHADTIRRQYNQDVEHFRQSEQTFGTRREFDLNRPDAKKVDSPARVGDDDERLGPSSLQKFAGEDLSVGDRTAAQQEQCKQWWADQVSLNNAVKEAERQSAAAYADLVRYQDLLQQSAKSQEAGIRRDLARATSEYNKMLAAEKKAREEQQQHQDLAANMAEIENTITSRFMTEDPTLAASVLSTVRVRKDHFKGMTEAEKQSIRDAQLAQMEEKRARLAQQQMEEAMYARTQADIMRALNEQARQVEIFKRNQAARSTGILKKQMEEKQEKDKELSQLYRNEIAPEFFSQFGTSHR